jgi:endonuclease/exonuclease/phosphatase family metal-dependent hydrolase
MNRRARRFVGATSLLVVAMTATVTLDPPRPEPAPSAPARKRPFRIPTVLSDQLTHSALSTCGRRERGAAPTRVRVATWNIRAALSAPVEALAAELAAMQADVVALQEVDVGTRRGGFVDEPGALARALGFQYVFAASIKWDEGDYGLAVLSRWPLTGVRRHRLTVIDRTEPRIVLEATVCANGRPLRLFNHHADRRVASRSLGFQEIRRLIAPDLGRGLLVVGDMNEYPDGPGVRSLVEAGLVDLGVESLKTTNNGRIDYVLADDRMARIASTARVWPTERSDHHAVLVDLEW